MMKAMKIYVRFLLVSLGLFGIFMLSGCSKEPTAELTKSGLNPADFQTPPPFMCYETARAWRYVSPTMEAV